MSKLSYHYFLQSLYRGNRPNRFAKFLNKTAVHIYNLGVAPNYLVTLEVLGRKSGKTVALPVVMVVQDDERYLVSMLGNKAQWVLNMTADDRRAVIRHGKREAIRLEDVPVEQRPPLIKKYLGRAPGARPHIPIDKDAPLAEFEKIAADYPVFRVVVDAER